MSGGLYLGTVTTNRFNVISTLGKTNVPFDAVGFTAGAVAPSTVAGHITSTPTTIDNVNYKLITLFGSVRSQATQSKLKIAFSADGVNWYDSSRDGPIITAANAGGGIDNDIPFSRDLETSSAFIGLYRSSAADGAEAVTPFECTIFCALCS